MLTGNEKHLSDLVGTHVLSGIETGNRPIGGWQYVRFTLDDYTYELEEDPDDGYRSYYNELECVGKKIGKIPIPNILVFCHMRKQDRYGSDVIEMYDAATGDLVLAVGTENCDDWYPFTVFEYYPENMICNEERKNDSD